MLCLCFSLTDQAEIELKAALKALKDLQIKSKAMFSEMVNERSMRQMRLAAEEKSKQASDVTEKESVDSVPSTKPSGEAAPVLQPPQNQQMPTVYQWMPKPPQPSLIPQPQWRPVQSTWKPPPLWTPTPQFSQAMIPPTTAGAVQVCC